MDTYYGKRIAELVHSAVRASTSRSEIFAISGDLVAMAIACLFFSTENPARRRQLLEQAAEELLRMRDLADVSYDPKHIN